MPIEFRCSQCQKLLRTGDETAGKKAKCPDCGSVMDIPQSSTADSSSPFGTPAGHEPGPSVPPSNPFQSGPAPGGLPPFGTPPVGSENPYQSPAGGFAPAPAGPALMPQGQVQPTPIDIGDVMGRAWRIFSDRMGVCIGAVFIVGLISNIPNVFSNVIQVVDPQLANEPAFALGVFGVSLLWGILSVWLTIGQTIIFLKVARGQETDIGELFAGGPFFLTALLASILFGLAYMAGILLCIVPGIIVALMFSQFLYLIVDQRLDVIESLSVSNQITTGNKATLFLLWLVVGLIMIGVAICTCGIGMLFAAPYMQMVMAVAYLTMTGQPTVEQMQMPQTQTPLGPPPMV